MTDQNKLFPHRPLRIFLKYLKAKLREPRQFKVQSPDRHCPICNYQGRFLSLGTPPRWDGRCPNCGSRERHRLIQLFLRQRHINLNDGRKILHFAAESYFIKMMSGNNNYHTADIIKGKARHTMDISNILFDEGHFDMVITNHVLEHVGNDHIALEEIYRVLKPGGFALITVPINWARETTYENPGVKTAEHRYGHYGDISHVRYYGRDFDTKLDQAMFNVECWRLPPEEEPKYGLLRDDVLWIATKPSNEL
jgi:SAM-dependent methyltransferase